MPEITKQLNKLTILKPSYLSLPVGKTVKMEITAPHVDNSGLLSIPAVARYDEEEKTGHFPLNTTNLRLLTAVLGNNTDTWKGAKYDVIVIPSNKPSGGGQVTGWAVIDGTVKKPLKS